MLIFALILVLAAQSLAAAPPGFVTANSDRFPPTGAAWMGSAPHRFLGGRITLFCGTHGNFSEGSALPEKRGESRVIRYNAEFHGELKVNDSALPFAGSWVIRDPIRMIERVTALGRRESIRHFATELLAIEFSGADFPSNVSIRESTARQSAGTMAVSHDRKGPYRIQSLYQVWLELSTDGGKTWRQADNAVEMRLEPVTGTATLSTHAPARP